MTLRQRRKSEYSAWCAMIQRCQNECHPRFRQYGGRGVEVCDRWSLSFENFLADMGPKPSPDLTLDRIDPRGNYEPANCRWISFDANRRNRRGEYRITEEERQRRREFARSLSAKAA
jgi:hypothetical protein